MDRKLLTVNQACQTVGVSRRTIYNWISTGRVEYVRTAGGNVRIFADSLLRSPSDGDANSLSSPDIGDVPPVGKPHR